MQIIDRIVTSVLRTRHAIAASDLAWMERNASKCIATRRKSVARLARELRRREAALAAPINADTIRHAVERQAKLKGGVL